MIYSLMDIKSRQQLANWGSELQVAAPTDNLHFYLAIAEVFLSTSHQEITLNTTLQLKLDSRDKNRHIFGWMENGAFAAS